MAEQTEPTIPERLRRLHRLYLAEAGAEAVSDGLARTVLRRINDELAEVEAAYIKRGCTPETQARIRVALIDELRTAARQQVRLGIVLAAYREAERSGAYTPKSQLTEKRGWLRQEATSVAAVAQQAIRTVLTAFQIDEED